MELFSQRSGFKPAKKVIQINSMDDDLRNGIWNGLFLVYFCNLEEFSCEEVITNLVRLIWIDYLKRPIDELDDINRYKLHAIKKYFFDLEWFEVYDFIEFVIHHCIDQNLNKEFTNYLNLELEKECSAYRFVGGKITEITSETEIAEIEEALKESPNPVNIHLENSLDLLSDRKSPDYRNSIKESISAVESICKMITQKPKGTLGRCLNEMEAHVELHPDLKDGFKKLYGYTSDSNGIRHALMEEPNLDFEDAKFMLVSCSAFINYLISKSTKSGIDLKL